MNSFEIDRKAPIVVALHGNPGYGGLLKRDTGIDSWHYITWRKWYPGESHARIAKRVALKIRKLAAGRPVILVGYSAGGSIIAHLTKLLSNIIAIVLYESPMFYMDEAPEGRCPVLWIENNNGRGLVDGERRNDKFGDEMFDTLVSWLENHSVELGVHGVGKHWEFTKGFPPVRHCWDKNLNNFILEWIDKMSRVLTGRPPIYLGVKP